MSADLENIKNRIKQKMQSAMGLKAKVLFDFKEDGCVFVDTTQAPPVISDEAPEGDKLDLTLTCSKDVFEKILAGTQDPNIAFMMGKLKIKGSMGLAMKLNSVLED